MIVGAEEPARARLRELGVVFGDLSPGAHNAITDVQGVRVGYSTLMRDEPSIVRTGVTAIWPFADDTWSQAAFAGVHAFNGYGEMTGALWLEEQGLLHGPVCITNTNSVGVVRDAMTARAIRQTPPRPVEAPLLVHLPVVAETYDGYLSDIDSLAVTPDMAFEAMRNAKSGPVAEGNVGGGAGMVCFEFKGGSGTASRVTPDGFVVGAFVQANFGAREMLNIKGFPAGRKFGVDLYPSPARAAADAGSIIVVLATDAPLLPIQCRRLARRATVGLARLGAVGATSSGDIYLAFSTANRIDFDAPVFEARGVGAVRMTPLFQAAAEAVEEAILNALSMAETMHGVEGRVAHAMPTREIAQAFGL